MQDNVQILGFTAGELSPWLTTRYDLQAYQRGAARLENFFVQPYGGLRRRRGTRYVGPAASQTPYAVRLMPFKFSESDVMMLEFYPSGIHFYRDGELLLKDGQPYSISTPWSTPEMVASLRWMQVNDVVYMMTPYYQTTMLMRLGDTNWKLTRFTPDPQPRETYLSQEVGLQVSMNKYGDMATLTLDAGEYFTPEMAKKEYVIADANTGTQNLFLNEAMTIQSTAMPDLSKTGAAVDGVYHEYNSATGMNEYYTCIRTYTSSDYNGSKSAKDYPHFFIPGVMRLGPNKAPYEVTGDWELKTTGEWDGQWELWRSYDSMNDTIFFRRWNWTCIKTFSQDAYTTRQNWAFSGSEDVPCRMVLVCRAYKGTSVKAMMNFRIIGSEREYVYRISSVVSPTVATADPVSFYGDTDPSFYTKKWSFGAFGVRNGYPRFAGLHQGRLWLGGTTGQPTTLYASTVGDYKNFRVRSADDAALHLTMATDDQSRICWICPMRNLLVGTTESEWTLSAPDGGSITSTNASFNRQSAVGSENKVAFGVENTVFYVQRGGKRMREISYKLEADGYTSTDASILAEHLFAAGVKEWAVQRGTCFHLWALMNDGSLAVLTTNPEQQVAAWQRASFPGRRVLNLAAIAHPGSAEDDVWFVLINESSGQVSIEYLSESNDYIDGCCEVCPGVDGEPVTLGAHVAGLPGLAYPKGCPQEAQAVEFDAEGSCRLEHAEAGQVYSIGAEYTSLLETMPLEREHSFNTVQQLGRVKLRLYESSPVFSYKSKHATEWEHYDPARDLLPPSYSGSIRISHIPSPGVGQGFCLQAAGAHDFALVSLTAEIDFHSR